MGVIANDPLLHQDKDVRQLITLLARLSEPDNIDIYFDGDMNGFNRRYTTYLRELKYLAIQAPLSNKKGEQNIIKEEIKTPKVELGEKIASRFLKVMQLYAINQSILPSRAIKIEILKQNIGHTKKIPSITYYFTSCWD